MRRCRDIELFLDFDINIFSMVLLIVLFITMKLRKEATGISSQLFSRLLWMTIFLLGLEILSWVFEGIEGKNELNYLTNFIFSWATSVVTCMFATYMDYYIFRSYERLKRRWFYIQPFILTGILLIINIFKPIIFSVSSANVYNREKLMILLPIINLITFVYICALAYRERKRINKEVLWVLLLYLVMPVVVAFIQVKIFGVYVLWPMMAVTEVLTYIFLETVSTSRDYLTGLLTRHKIDMHLEYMLEHKRDFILVMIDLNKFKMINDVYGHLSGDAALKLFSQALLSEFGKKKTGIVGRYAGDEFILILEKIKCSEMRQGLKRIKSEMKSLYDSGKTEFLITFSSGHYHRQGHEDISYENVINIADKRMYGDKEKVRNEK